MIELEIFTDDQRLIDLIGRYWAVGRDGRYVHSVASMLPFGEITDSRSLLKLINEHSRAWNPDNVCACCGGVIVAMSRSASEVKTFWSPHKCISCLDLERRKAEEILDIERGELLLKIELAAERIQNKYIEYAAIPDDLAIVVLALERAIGLRRTSNGFRFSEVSRLMSGVPDGLLKRLHEAQVITDNPDPDHAGGYWISEGNLCFNWRLVEFSLLPDQRLGKTREALASLANRSFSQGEVLRTLWITYAVDECMTYFSSQCSRYRLNPEICDLNDIAAQLHQALELYSIQNLWCALWSVVREAAALCNHQYFNLHKATATMPGKLKRLLDAVRKKKRQPLKAWARPDYQPMGTLGNLFFEIFGINEGTPGSLVSTIFSYPACTLADQYEQNQIATGEAVEALFQRIHERKLTAKSLSFFAEAIRKGSDLNEAVAELLQAFPTLQAEDTR